MFDVLFHRVPWNYDCIRLYRGGESVKPIDVFIGEFYLKIKHGAVLVLDNTDRRYIRRDLPKWSNRHSCWEYWYYD